jgi:hypothetical protein
MANNKKKETVAELVEEFKGGKSPRFKRKDLERMVLAVISDKGHKAIKKSYDLKKGTLLETSVNHAEIFDAFVDSVLKFADIGEKERAQIVANYEPKEKDIAWVIDVVEEAEYMYIMEGNKALKKWADKGFNLAVRKREKEGKVSLSRSLKDLYKFEKDLKKL